MTRCAALKADGTKCANHARETSKYCASHKGYRPSGRPRKVLAALKKARSMKVVRKRAAKTGGGRGAIRNRPAAVKAMGGRSRCAATTGSGKRCKNLPRPGSKYCASHKGFRPKRS